MISIKHVDWFTACWRTSQACTFRSAANSFVLVSEQNTDCGIGVLPVWRKDSVGHVQGCSITDPGCHVV